MLTGCAGQGIEGTVFANPTVKGNTMTYDVGVEGDISTMIFKRVK